jgi:transcriptional regulator with XRE-family HTH domain
MANKKDFRPLTPFATAFSVEYKGWMLGHNVTQKQLADELQRTVPYVSERINAKRALDTLDVDALAVLTSVTPRDLMIELAKRAKQQIQPLADDEKLALSSQKARQNDMRLAALDNAEKEAEAEHDVDAGA